MVVHRVGSKTQLMTSRCPSLPEGPEYVECRVALMTTASSLTLAAFGSVCRCEPVLGRVKIARQCGNLAEIFISRAFTSWIGVAKSPIGWQPFGLEKSIFFIMTGFDTNTHYWNFSSGENILEWKYPLRITSLFLLIFARVSCLKSPPQ